MSEYYAPPGHDATPKPLALFRDRCKRDRWGAELDVLMELYNRHGHDAVKRHLSRIRAILAAQSGGHNVYAA